MAGDKQIEIEKGELDAHVQASLDDSHRELALIRAVLIALLYAVLGLVNYLTLAEEMKLAATMFALIVAVAFLGFACFHKFVNYSAAGTNMVTFFELSVLQVDSIAFTLVTDGIMSGFGLYLMIVGAGIFMTNGRWIVISIVMLTVTWITAVWARDAAFIVNREGMMLVSAVLICFFFYSMRVRSARRLGEHELMEQKYKEGLEEALAHIDTLSGLLPICARCKNIRDDDGNWALIEEYVMARAEVEFTHSLCPECRDEMYPELSS